MTPYVVAGTGPVFCVLLGVSSDYAQPITGQVTEVTCPVIGRAQPELTPSERQKMGPGQHRVGKWLRSAAIGYTACDSVVLSIWLKRFRNSGSSYKGLMAYAVMHPSHFASSGLVSLHIRADTRRKINVIMTSKRRFVPSTFCNTPSPLLSHSLSLSLSFPLYVNDKFWPRFNII